MRWDKESETAPVAQEADAIDVAFRLSGRWLPVDHARALRASVLKVLPWLEDEPQAGIHSIHGAASGNGWERPANEPGEMLSLSRRTRMGIRVPIRRADETGALHAQRLDIDGYEIAVGASQPRRLKPTSTVFARYVVDEDGADEERFVERVASELSKRAINARKLLCGRSHRVDSERGVLTTRGLLVADLGHDESVEIQCRGIGPERLLGCGLFVPHKDIGPVRRRDGVG